MGKLRRLLLWMTGQDLSVETTVTGRQQLAVAQSIVYAGHIYPELVFAYAWDGVSCFFAAIAVFPFVGYNFVFRVWSIHQYVIVGRGVSPFYFLYLFPELQLDFVKVVQLGQTFAFRRFNHQRAVYREGKGRSVIAVVHQPFGDVIFADSAFFV